jgi:protein-L-isoaspartate(D-aspartate) O-methyltransferase
MSQDGPRRGARFPLELAATMMKPVALHHPQAVLRQVAQAARPRETAAPLGLGLDSAGVRQRMVSRLRADGIRDERLLSAFAKVPRHLFVDSGLANQAYEDTSLPIGLDQTISKPSVVARMLELLLQGANALAAGQLLNVLEIGTGCGYQAALLSQLSRRVVSVERIKPLHDKARELLAPLRTPGLRLVYDDGMLGHSPLAPFDGIVAAAGGESLPAAWLDQLAIGGRLVAPLQTGTHTQQLMVVDRSESGYTHTAYEAVLFVPLKSGRHAG